MRYTLEERIKTKILLDASCVCENIEGKDEKEKAFNSYIRRHGIYETYIFVYDERYKFGKFKKLLDYSM